MLHASAALHLAILKVVAFSGLTGAGKSTLVSHRFLTLAGMHPRLAIGFNTGAGHSWVVLGDKPLFESQARLLDYRPILSLRAGDTRRAEITPLEDNSATCAKTLTVSLRTTFKNII